MSNAFKGAHAHTPKKFWKFSKIPQAIIGSKTQGFGDYTVLVFK